MEIGIKHQNISIHALVKRATAVVFTKNLACVISIHALVKRATILDIVPDFITRISIHALVKRATDFRA